MIISDSNCKARGSESFSSASLAFSSAVLILLCQRYSPSLESFSPSSVPLYLLSAIIAVIRVSSLIFNDLDFSPSISISSLPLINESSFASLINLDNSLGNSLLYPSSTLLIASSYTIPQFRNSSSFVPKAGKFRIISFLFR